MDRDTEQLKRMIDERALEVVRQYMKSSAFTDRKLTDTPTDALSVVPRKYITRNGATASRPTSSVLGESFYDTSLSKPVYWNGSTWKDAAGNNA